MNTPPDAAALESIAKQAFERQRETFGYALAGVRWSVRDAPYPADYYQADLVLSDRPDVEALIKVPRDGAWRRIFIPDTNTAAQWVMREAQFAVQGALSSRNLHDRLDRLGFTEDQIRSLHPTDEELFEDLRAWVNGYGAPEDLGENLSVLGPGGEVIHLHISPQQWAAQVLAWTRLEAADRRRLDARAAKQAIGEARSALGDLISECTSAETHIVVDGNRLQASSRKALPAIP